MKQDIPLVGPDTHKERIPMALLLAEQVKPVEWTVANETVGREEVVLPALVDHPELSMPFRVFISLAI